MTNIFEDSTKTQKAAKPPIEDVCGYFLTDPVLKEGMARLIKISRELKMKPGWVQINGYKCNYKGKGVVSYVIGGNGYLKDYLIVGVSLADRQDLEKTILSLPDDMIKELQNRNHTYCRVCRAATCGYGGFSYKYKGERHYLCSRFNYMCKNPNAEQFGMIERFIKIRRAYLDENSKIINA